MSFELILPFLRPIEPLLLDEASAKSWAIPMLHGGTNATESSTKRRPFPSTQANSALAWKSLPISLARNLTKIPPRGGQMTDSFRPHC
jgi:hypothetical protein